VSLKKRKKYKPEPPKLEKERVSRKIEWTPLDFKKHGIGGLVKGRLRYRKQEKRAASGHCYAVVFFPRIKGIGGANVDFYIRETMASSPEVVIAKFMDRIARSETWATYYKAGHKVRKIKLVDAGPAPLGRRNV
jgi:hypothetical protein